MANIIAFDVDGTLFNTMKGVQAALNHTLAVYNLPPIPDEDMSQYIGPPIRESFMNLLNNHDLAEEADFHFIGVSYGHGSFPNTLDCPIANSVMEIAEYI